MLTTHRVLWLDSAAAPESGASCMIPLSAVHRIELRSSMVLKSPKIRILVYVGQHGRPAPGMSPIGC